MSAAGKRVLVYGGRGALGSTCVDYFRGKNWWVGSVDLAANEKADQNCIVEPCESWTEQEKQVLGAVETLLGGEKIDAIICVAGGWAGGNAASKDLVKNADLMWRQSVWSSTIAAHIASKYMNEGGFLALTGAEPALGPTPGMMGYGMAKAAVMQLTKSLAGKSSGLPEGAKVAAILPVTLDTPMNRKFMAKADKTTWTPLDTVAELLFNWCDDVVRPDNGSLIKIITKDSNTDFIPV